MNISDVYIFIGLIISILVTSVVASSYDEAKQHEDILNANVEVRDTYHELIEVAKNDLE